MSVNSSVLFVVFLFGCVLMKMNAASLENIENSNEISSRGLDAKSLFSSLAGNLFSRGFYPTGAAGSQIVSLNLTNLLVLVLLKALIFAAGSIGFGELKGHHGYARSNSEDNQKQPFLTEDEVMMFISYLTGSPGDNGCLQNISCRQPVQANKYIAAADILLKASKMFSIEPENAYYYILKEVEEAVKTGENGGNCEIYTCVKQTT